MRKISASMFKTGCISSCSFQKSWCFSEHLLVTVYLLCLLIFTFVAILFFSSFKFFLLLKRHYIGFFGIAIFYSCVRSTSANMFSANWESLPQFDKNVCLFVCLFFWGGGSSLTHKDEEYPCTSPHPQNNKYMEKYIHKYINTYIDK